MFDTLMHLSPVPPPPGGSTPASRAVPAAPAVAPPTAGAASASRRPGIGIAFTDREGGVSASDIGPLNLGRSDADDPLLVQRNLELVRQCLGVRALVTTSQVHGRDVLVVDDALVEGWTPARAVGTAAGAPALPVADAMVTTLAGVALCIRVADCMPVLFADADAGVIAAAHAGRVGLLDGVLPATVQRMRALGADSIQAWLGPHVCGGCYEVPEQMAADAEAALPGVRATTTWGTPSIDLAAGAQEQLDALGVPLERIDPCTVESPHLHSHRRDAARSGRLAGIIWRVSEPA